MYTKLVRLLTQQTIVWILCILFLAPAVRPLIARINVYGVFILLHFFVVVVVGYTQWEFNYCIRTNVHSNFECVIAFYKCLNSLHIGICEFQTDTHSISFTFNLHCSSCTNDVFNTLCKYENCTAKFNHFLQLVQVEIMYKFAVVQFVEIFAQMVIVEVYWNALLGAVQWKKKISKKIHMLNG